MLRPRASQQPPAALRSRVTHRLRTRHRSSAMWWLRMTQSVSALSRRQSRMKRRLISSLPSRPESDSIIKENANYDVLELIPRSDVASGLSWAAATDPRAAAGTWRRNGGQHVPAASATVPPGGSANDAVAHSGIEATRWSADGARPGDHSVNGSQDNGSQDLVPNDLVPNGLAPDDQAVTSPSAFSEEEVKSTARLAWERWSERERGTT